MAPMKVRISSLYSRKPAEAGFCLHKLLVSGWQWPLCEGDILKRAWALGTLVSEQTGI